jgi:hypothetical protein
MTTQKAQHSERIPGLMAEKSIPAYPHLASVLGVNEAIILQQVYFYVTLHSRKKSTQHFHDGKFWVFNSYKQWRDQHFPWLTARGVQSIILRLETKGLLISRQGLENPQDRRKWYTIDLEKLAKLIPTSKINSTQTARPTNTDCTSNMHEMIDDSTESTSENTFREKELQKQTTTEIDVVVDSPALPYREPEAESGEHSLDGEGHDATAVKAFVPHEQHHDEQPFPKVPVKGFPALVAELVKFRVLPVTAQRLVDRYPEVDVRYVLEYARGESSLRNPPGFVVDELDTRKHGVLAARDQNKYIQTLSPSPQPKRFIPPDDFVCTDEEREEIGLIGFERFMALRHEIERYEAEDRERATGQTLTVDPHIEYA